MAKGDPRPGAQGEKHGAARLTEKAVREIRNNSTETYAEMARRFGVSSSRVYEANARYVLARVPEIVMADRCADDEERKRLQTLLELVEQPRF